MRQLLREIKREPLPLILGLALGGWAVRLFAPRFWCPDCGKGYRNYYDGIDCACDTIHLCRTCYESNHREHDHSPTPPKGS